MNTIALAFSGGGFRAACFSLGTLSYLQHLRYNDRPLLENVKFISSTSGGSITNLVFSRFHFHGIPFQKCYAFLNEKLDGEALLARALKILSDSSEWKKRPEKSRNIINAFSIAYDELLFTGDEWALFDKHNADTTLQEICINSTEFTNGLPFRFQSAPPDNQPKGLVGNRFIYFKKTGFNTCSRLKLGDILASSSCFPSGFEPMIFPEDYTHAGVNAACLRAAISYKANRYTLPDDETAEETETTATEAEMTPDAYNHFDLLKDEQFTNEVRFGIMDGGVADNQAIDAFKKADARRKENKFDLFIATDVTSYLMDGYTLPLEKKKWYNIFSLNFIWISWLLLSLALPLMLLFIKKPWTPWMYVAGTLSGLMLLPVVWLLFTFLKGIIAGKKEKNSWQLVFKKYKSVFLGVRIGALKQMLRSRAKSVFILANDIYLKQIRRMYYDALYADPNYRDRFVQNAIYDLSLINFSEKDLSTDPLHPSAVLIAMSEKARTMGTTLWFDKKHQAAKMKESIISSGQFTCCYNLLKYVNKKEASGLTSAETALKQQLEKDWEQFNLQPDWLLNGPF